MSGTGEGQPASAKKLKQACLPFKLVNTPVADGAGAKGRKRKLSGTENDLDRVENTKVELVNGGAKCFIKSDAEDSSREISFQDIDNEGANESVEVDSSENCSERNVEDIIDLDSLKVGENVMDIDDTAVSSDSNPSLNNTSIISASESGKMENTPPSAKILSSTGSLKKTQNSARKKEERDRLKQEREKAKEEKLRLKQLEKGQKRIEAKRLRELEKEKEKQQKEEERKIKELEKERERKQKEEERKAKEFEREKEKKQKEEERKAKELEREKEKKQKEEERKTKELEKEKLKEEKLKEKLLKEEQEKKKNEKVKAAFLGFFKPKSANLDSSKIEEEKLNNEQETYFMPFQTKQDMRIAPSFRATLNCDRKLTVDKCISQCEQNTNLLYLNLLKTGKHKPSKSEATWPIQVEDDDDVIIVETGLTNYEGLRDINTSLKKNSCKYRWKLLQFHENKRPPYCGTWRKKSLYVKPRRPFACDKIMFDYEVDSDDEWEEEDPGESIHGTDDEVEPEDDYEVDNDVFVPHGYLSDEEGDGQCNDDISEEVQKEKLKLLGEEFEAEINKKTERIKPRLVGCIWIPNNVTNPENMSKSVSDTLLKYRCIWDGEEPIVTETILEESPKDVSENKKILIPDSVIPNLITFVHGSTNGINVVAKNFIDELVKNGQNVGDSAINISSVKRTVKTIATKSTHMSPWSVGKDSFEKYGVNYPKIVENEIPKSSKISFIKITNFLTPQSQTEKIVTSFDKSCTESDQNDVSQFDQSGFVPKNLFDVNENPKPVIKDAIKQEQKINIVGGKKRITPVLLSPKKSFKSVTDKKC